MAAAPKSAPVPALKAARGAAPKSQAVALKSKAVAKKASPFGNLSEIGAPLAVLGIVMAMITPMPAFLLDILISANITIAVIVMLVSMYITKPVEFSVFPTTLLLLTLFRLALNISS
ncbi:MAG TPA: FHIPEP family type III secretion protein, partial [Bryobacteraceae bacterium]|nr:FHIPEP family type III secretion protein [Bryobacteraceae bacterium]